MNDMFTCNSKQLSDYLVKNGSKLIKTDYSSGRALYVFSLDDTIKSNLDKWETDRKRCLF